MAYKIEVSTAARRVFDKLPAATQRQLAKTIDGLSDNPRSAQAVKLTGKDLYRVRSGDYRVIYQIQDKILLVVVVKIGHRREVYRD
jgi:mRNA interferase RelE/StbE